MKNRSAVSDLIFVLIIIFLAFASVISYLRVTKQNDASYLVLHNNLVRNKLGELLTYTRESVKNFENIILKTDSSIGPMLLSDSLEIVEKSNGLDSLTKEETGEHARILEINSLHNKWNETLLHERMIARTEKKAVMDLIDANQMYITRIQAVISEMRHNEDDILYAKVQARDRSAFLTPLYSLLLSFLAIAFVALIYFRLRNETQLRMKANLALEQSVGELEQSNAELASFNYIASHDLQEPLRKIIAFSKRIEDMEQEGLSTTAKDYFSRIIRATARMQNLIDAFLSYSQTTNVSAAMEEVDLNKLFREVKNDFADKIEQKNISLQSKSLPVIAGIPLQIFQAFTNLIGNAIKFSRTGIDPKIQLFAEKCSGNDMPFEGADNGRDYWKISIVDNGIGFDQAHEHQIFELFQRLHNRQEYAGTGIGLAICKKIMRNHKGFISATGTKDAGASFSMYFPVYI